MKNSNAEAFAAYLLENHYSSSTAYSYCRSLSRIGVDYSLRTPKQLYENIKLCLNTYSTSAPLRSFEVAKVAANRYFEMLVGHSISDFETIQRGMTQADRVQHEFYDYSVGFKKISEASAMAECQHIRAFLEKYDKKNFDDLSTITALDIRNYVTHNFLLPVEPDLIK